MTWLRIKNAVIEFELLDAPPEPPANTKGKITHFTDVNGEYIQIDGVKWGNNTVNKPHCLQQLDDYTLRFEVRPGDVWGAANGSYQDQDCNRCEVSTYDVYDEGVTLHWEATVTVEDGPVMNGSWNGIVQLHATTNVYPTYCPFVFGFGQGTDRLQVILQEPHQEGNNYIYTSPEPIPRGVPVRLRADVKMGPWGDGRVECWMNDEKIVDFSGKVGADSSQYYWKFGFYRGETPETVVVTFKNVYIGYTAE